MTQSKKKPDPRATAVKRAAAITEAGAKRTALPLSGFVRHPTGPVRLDPSFAKSRLRGSHPLVAQNRRLMSVTPNTYKKLQARAKELSKEVGFVVWPMQIAALIVERGA